MTGCLVYSAQVPCSRRWRRPTWRTVYVGRTNDLDRRIRQHERERTGPHKRYAVVQWTIERDGLTLDESIDVETALIRRLQPECNGRVEAPSWLARACRRVVAWLATVRRWVRLSLEVVGAVALMWWWLG